MAIHTEFGRLMVDLLLMTGRAEFPGPIHPRVPCLGMAAGTRATFGMYFCRVSILSMLLMTGSTTCQRTLRMMILVARRAGILDSLAIIPTMAIDAPKVGVLLVIQRKRPNPFGISNRHSHRGRHLLHTTHFGWSVTFAAPVRCGRLGRMVAREAITLRSNGQLTMPGPVGMAGDAFHLRMLRM